MIERKSKADLRMHSWGRGSVECGILTCGKANILRIDINDLDHARICVPTNAFCMVCEFRSPERQLGWRIGIGGSIGIIEVH